MARNEFSLVPTSHSGIHCVSADSAFKFSRHTHDTYCFGLIDRGAQRWHSDRKIAEAGAGTVIMCNPGEVHDGSPIGEGGRAWRMLNVAQSVVDSAVQRLGLGGPGTFEFVSPVATHPDAAKLMGQLFSALLSRHDHSALVDQLLLLLLPMLGNVSPHSRVNFGRSPRIARAIEQIRDHPSSNVSLRELAELVEMSPWHFLRSFSRETGFTPHAYQMQCRVELARRLISRGSGLTDAALESGFADQSHMTRIFRRTYGVSPGTWALASHVDT